MKFITKELEKQFRANAKLPEMEQKVIAHYFNPYGQGDWYAITYDEETNECFGYVHLHEGEFGYFSLTELAEVKVPPFNMGIERDLHFTPCDRANIVSEVEGLHPERY